MSGVLPGLPGGPDLTAAEKAAVVAHACRTEFEFFARRGLADILPAFEDNWHIGAMFNIGSRIADGELRRARFGALARKLGRRTAGIPGRSA